MSRAVIGPAGSLVQRLYRVLDAGDVEGLLGVLHQEFTADISPGMPLGVGGLIVGPRAMLTDVWGRIATAFAVRPAVDEVIDVSGDRVIARGQYVGTAHQTGRSLVAPFVHDWGLCDGLVHRLVQVTDTRLWHEALDAEGTWQ